MGPPTPIRRSLVPVAAISVSRGDGAPSDLVIRFMASTANVARDGGIVDPLGW